MTRLPGVGHRLEIPLVASPASNPNPTFQRLRIRFRKQHMLRWISHHDLMRMFERLVRRAGLQPCLSQGYHPKPKIRFASALALGVEGWDEVVELDLAQPADPDSVLQWLAAQAPEGLTIHSVQAQPAGSPKARLAATCYAIDIPADRREAVDQAMERLRSKPHLAVRRQQEDQATEVPLLLEELVRHGPTVHFRLAATSRRAARPRDILAALGLDDLPSHGGCLRRTAVELVR
jgi:radical SAM-linked protein